MVREFVGHGIGTSLHEDPQVPNYGPPGRRERLVAGMCLAIEPMKVRRIRINGSLPRGVYAKDVILAIIERLGVSGGVGYAYEYAGDTVARMSMVPVFAKVPMHASELPEIAAPLVPNPWRDVTVMTAAFGHGISVTPLQLAVRPRQALRGDAEATLGYLSQVHHQKTGVLFACALEMAALLLDLEPVVVGQGGADERDDDDGDEVAQRLRVVRAHERRHQRGDGAHFQQLPGRA